MYSIFTSNNTELHLYLIFNEAKQLGKQPLEIAERVCIGISTSYV
jgi:hypothetical protein